MMEAICLIIYMFKIQITKIWYHYVPYNYIQQGLKVLVMLRIVFPFVFFFLN